MKTKNCGMIVSMAVVTLLVVPRLSLGVEALTQPVSAQQSVFFSPNQTQLALPAELQNVPPHPAPLSPEKRNLAINQIRGIVGLKALVSTNMSYPLIPVHLVLTPDIPRSGLSSYAVNSGDNYPNPQMWTGSAQSMPLSVFGRISNSFLLFNFHTAPGKSYMVDLFLGSPTPYLLEGVFVGEATPQNYHLIIGFKAVSMWSTLKVKPKYGGVPRAFYRCEVTQVD